MIKKMIKISLAAVLVCLFAVNLTGCSGAEAEARESLEDILNAMKLCDKDKIDEYYSFDRVTAYIDKTEGDELRDAVVSTLKSMDYKINSTSKSGENAVNADVELTTVDFSEIVENFTDEVIEIVNGNEYQSGVSDMTEEDYRSMMVELMKKCIADASNTRVTRNLTVTMVKGTSGKWTIGGNSDEFLGALFADVSDALNYLV